MDKMIGYIFSSLRKTDVALCDIHKAIKAQKSINIRLGWGVLLTTLGLYSMAKRIDEQNKTINKLNKDIEELKSEKGE